MNCGGMMTGYVMSPPQLHPHMAGVGQAQAADAAAALYQFHAAQAALAQQQFQYESMISLPGPMMPLRHPGAYGMPGMPGVHQMAGMGMPYAMQGAMMGAAAGWGGHMPMAPPVLHPAAPRERETGQRGSPAPTVFHNGCGKRVAFERVESSTWLKDLQFSAGRAFDRLWLTDRSGPERRDSVLAAILAGKDNDRRPSPTAAGSDNGGAARRPCFIVKRDHDRKTHFQVQVSGARVLAQKVVVACCKPKYPVFLQCVRTLGYLSTL